MFVTGVGQCSFDCLGVVDSFPEIDTKKEVIQWEENGGGPVATALVALSRLGIHCGFHGIIGSDTAGEMIKQSLIDEHIDIKGLIERRNCSSQQAFIAIERASGKRTIFWKRPSGDELRAEELGQDFLKDSTFLLLDGLMRDVSLYAARLAQRQRVPVMLDAGRVREGMIEIAKNSDYVVASEEFAKDLGWDGSMERLQKVIRELGLGITTITLGERGSVTFLDNKIINISAFRVKVTDTTGAGDVFHGGYIYGLLKGWELTDTITFASALAALKCREIGGRAGIPDLKNVLLFLRERYPGHSYEDN